MEVFHFSEVFAEWILSFFFAWFNMIESVYCKKSERTKTTTTQEMSKSTCNHVYNSHL